MEGIPGELTRQYLIEHSEYTLFSPYHQWQAWMWRQIVLLDLAGKWESDHYPHYFKEFWDIFCERSRDWNPVYFVIDITDLQIQDVDFRTYVKSTWLHLVEREDLMLCFVEAEEMKRIIREAMHHLLGIQDKVLVFATHDQALQWVRSRLQAACPRGEGSAKKDIPRGSSDARSV